MKNAGMPTYSKTLTQSIISYFKNTHNHEITEAQAIEYLDSLADLFDSYQASLMEAQGLPPETDQDK